MISCQRTSDRAKNAGMTKNMLPPYRQSIAGTLLAAREAVMAPIRPTLRDAGVTEQQWRVLRVLNDRGAIDPTGLADAALLFAPSVTRILKDLVDRALVTRAPDPRDRRRSIVSLTPAGKALLDDTAAHTLAMIQSYGERFGRDRLDALLDELRAFTEAIDRS